MTMKIVPCALAQSSEAIIMHRRIHGLYKTIYQQIVPRFSLSQFIVSVAILLAAAAAPAVAKPQRQNSRVLDLVDFDTSDNDIGSQRNTVKKYNGKSSFVGNIDATNKKSSLAHYSSDSQRINYLFQTFLEQLESDTKNTNDYNSPYSSFITPHTTLRPPKLSTELQLFSTDEPKLSDISSSSGNESVILDMTSLSEYFPLYRRLMEGLADETRLSLAWNALVTNQATNVFDVAAILLHGENLLTFYLKDLSYCLFG